LHDLVRRFSSRQRRRPQSLGGFAFTIAAAAWLCFATAWPTARAQTFDATNLKEPAELGTTWLVHAGDDPAYADPSFGDSHWTPFDPHASITSVFVTARPEVIWYRLHVKVDPNQTGLA
jgi:hypothetical protein